MCKIYKAPTGWNPTELNPFTTIGHYGKEWSAFIYDEEIQHYSNIFDGTKVYVNNQVQEKDVVLILQIADGLGYIINKL